MNDTSDIDQICYTVHSPEAEWLAEHLPLQVHGMWFGAFGIIRTAGRRVVSLALNQTPIAGSTAGTMGYDGITVDIISLDHGPLVKQTLFFRDYIPRPEGMRAPCLERTSRTSLNWLGGTPAFKPDLNHLATAIMALVDVFTTDGGGVQQGFTSVVTRHQPPGVSAALTPGPQRAIQGDAGTYHPPLPRGHTDPEQEILVVEDEPG